MREYKYALVWASRGNLYAVTHPDGTTALYSHADAEHETGSDRLVDSARDIQRIYDLPGVHFAVEERVMYAVFGQEAA